MVLDLLDLTRYLSAMTCRDLPCTKYDSSYDPLIGYVFPPVLLHFAIVFVRSYELKSRSGSAKSWLMTLTTIAASCVSWLAL